jgi:hypothetical protein
VYDDDEIWDEFRWEEFMKEQDKKVDRYMELFYRYRDDPNRDEIIAREMGWTWLLEQRGSERIEDAEQDDDDAEAWKQALDPEKDELFDWEAFEHLPVYQLTHAFALRAFRYVDQLPDATQGDSAVVDFVSNAMIAGAKIAGGTGIGEDRDELGGNIAYCKRGLAAANLTIAALHEMKQKKIIRGRSYIEMVDEATEVRNAIAIHVLDLREKFRGLL